MSVAALKQVVCLFIWPSYLLQPFQPRTMLISYQVTIEFSKHVLLSCHRGSDSTRQAPFYSNKANILISEHPPTPRVTERIIKLLRPNKCG